MSSNLYNFMHLWGWTVETIKRKTRTAYGCLVAGQSQWARGWTAAYRLYAHCDTQSTTAAAVCGFVVYAWYMCYMPLPSVWPACWTSFYWHRSVRWDVVDGMRSEASELKETGQRLLTTHMHTYTAWALWQYVYASVSQPFWPVTQNRTQTMCRYPITH